MPDDVNREELIAAREELRQQLSRLVNPLHFRDRNRPLEDKLSSMIEEITRLLGEPVETDDTNGA